MKTIVIPVLIAAAAVYGCTFKSTTVRPTESPPPRVVYVEPAPTVVYQAPTTTMAYDGSRAVTVRYSGLNGFDLAVRKATDWCDQQYGMTDTRLIQDDRVAGRAVFECVG